MRFAIALGTLLLLATVNSAQEKLPQPKVMKVPAQPTFPVPASLLGPNTYPIRLEEAFQLAGVQNAQIQIARTRVLEALAQRQLAAAQLLPNVNVGGNFNHHLGTLQQANGNILEVHRDSLYVGMGAGAVGGGTVTIPGLAWSANTSELLFRILVRRQNLAQAEFNSEAVRNEMMLRVASSYLDLLRASIRLAIALEMRELAQEVARVTANYAKTGLGRQADALRAETEFQQRSTEVVQAENDILQASARLAQLLHLDPAVRLLPADPCALPQALVPDPMPLPELLAIALVQRPEMKERQAAVQAALLELRGAKLLPFSPNILLGYSAGIFGGGGNLIPTEPRFGNFGDRTDFDAIVHWSLRNLGVGNLALIRLGQSQVRQNQWRLVEVLDRVRAEVASAQARVQARFAQIDIAERAVQVSREAFQEDLVRTKNREGLPIEVLDSLRLLGRSRLAHLDAVIDYNRGQFELYFALGQPPADCLIRPVPPPAAPSP